MNEYDQYIIQIFNTDKLCEKWIDQEICSCLEEAKDKMELMKLNRFEFCDKIRIIRREIRDRVVIWDKLIMVPKAQNT